MGYHFCLSGKAIGMPPCASGFKFSLSFRGSMYDNDCAPEDTVIPRNKFVFITKTRLYSFNPVKSHFYTVKLGFTGVYIDFLISAQKHRLWVLVRPASARRF